MLELILKVTVTDVLLFSDFPSFWNLITYNLMQNQKKILSWKQFKILQVRKCPAPNEVELCNTDKYQSRVLYPIRNCINKKINYLPISKLSYHLMPQRTWDVLKTKNMFSNSNQTVITKLTQKHTFCLSFTKNWFENTKKRLWQLVIKVILRINANVVLNHIYRILQNYQHKQNL